MIGLNLKIVLLKRADIHPPSATDPNVLLVCLNTIVICVGMSLSPQSTDSLDHVM